MNPKEVIESLLFVSREPLTPRAIRKLLREAEQFDPSDDAKALAKLKEGELLSLIAELREEIAHRKNCFVLEEVAGGFRLATRPEFAPWVQHLFDVPKSGRLSQPALETLAIIAYRQPISRAEIEEIRGVAVDGVVSTLQERGLIRATGRAQAAGRPLIYETTAQFLDHFGLKSLDELPNAAELRRPAQTETAPLTTAAESAEPEASGPELPLSNEPQTSPQADRPDRPEDPVAAE